MKLCERALIYGAGSLGPHRSPHRYSIRAEEGSAWSQGLNLQASLSLGFSRQEYRNGLPFPSPGHLPNPGIKPESPARAGGFFTTEPPGKPSSTLIDPQFQKVLKIWKCISDSLS